MTASDRTPVGDPTSDPTRDSDSALPRTYVRTDGEGLVTRGQQVRVSSAREPKKTLIQLSDDDLHFIVSYDPERERSANRRDLVAVIEEFQALICEGCICAGEMIEGSDA